jgi:hypothetical protein
MRRLAQLGFCAIIFSSCAGSPGITTSAQDSHFIAASAYRLVAPAGLTATFGTSKIWKGGFSGTIVIANKSPQNISWSTLSFTLAPGASIAPGATVWGAATSFANDAGTYTMIPGSNRRANPIAAGSSVEIDYDGTGAFSGVGSTCTLDGASCVSGSAPTPDPTASATATPTPTAAPSSPAGLNPGVAPGGNFNLANWELDLPLPSGNSVKIIQPSQLVGSSGFTDSYFYTAADGGMAFFVPENGAHTPNSNYPRSELRELSFDGSNANWPMTGTNVMTATLKVVNVTDHTVVGQVHIGSALQSGLASSTKPLLELYYYANGKLVMGLEKSPSGSQTDYTIGTVPVGTVFRYSIEVSGDTITIGLNGANQTFTASPNFNGYGMYFKAGNYLQTTGNSSTVGSLDEFYALTVSH